MLYYEMPRIIICINKEKTEVAWRTLATTGEPASRRENKNEIFPWDKHEFGLLEYIKEVKTM